MLVAQCGMVELGRTKPYMYISYDGLRPSQEMYMYRAWKRHLEATRWGPLKKNAQFPAPVPHLQRLS